MKLKSLTSKLVLLFLAVINLSVAHDVLNDFNSLGVQGATMHGQKSQLNLSIPVPDYILENELTVNLRFHASDLLDPANSYISVYAKGEPLITKNLPDSSLFSLIIGGLTAEDGYVNLQLISNLAISEEPCKDIGNPGLWLKLLNNSSLLLDSLNAHEFNDNLIGSSLFNKQAIVVPTDLQVQQEPAVAKLAFAIENIVGKKLPIVYYSQTENLGINNYIFVALDDQVPAVLKSKLSFQAQPRAGRIEMIQVTKADTNGTTSADILVVSGLTDLALNKAVNLFLNKNILSGAFTDNSTVINAIEPNNVAKTPLSPYLSLQELGASSFPLGGLGSSNSSFKFKRSDIVLPCTYVELNLVGNYSGLKTNDKAFLNIYLNNQLLYTEPLENSSSIDSRCQLKMDELLDDNLITYEFLYLPGKKECNLSANSFVAQVNTEKSGIVFPNNASRKPATFNYFPENFYADDISIIYSPDFGLNNVVAIKEMLHLINKSRGLSSAIIPEVVNSREIRMKEHKSNNRILLLSISDSSFFNSEEAILQRVGDKLTINRFGEPAYSILLNNQVSLGQVYEDDELVLSLVADPLGSPNGLVNLIKRIGERTFKEPVDLLVSRSDNHVFLQSSTVQKNQSKAGFKLSNFWSKYGVVLSVVVLVLILLGFFVINKKSDPSEDLI